PSPPDPPSFPPRRSSDLYDAAFAVPDPFPDSASDTGSDPILDGITRAYGGAFVGYARDELGFKTEMTYQLLAHEVSSKWNWGGRSEEHTSELQSPDHLVC